MGTGMSTAAMVLANTELDVDESQFVMVVVTADSYAWRMAINKDAISTLNWQFYMEQAMSRVLNE